MTFKRISFTLSNLMSLFRRTALPVAITAMLSISFFSRGEKTAPPDSISLGEVEVTARTARAVTSTADGQLRVSTRALMMSGRMFGEADVVNIMRRLPSVSTRSDYSSGVSVEGTTPSQTVYRIAGAPVFFPYRFGGIFSTFSTPHFSHVNIEKTIRSAASPPRLGATVDFMPFDRIPDRARATLNVGMLSSSFAFRIPVGLKASVAASARISYIDRIYSRMLVTDRQGIGYSFSDFNLSALYIPSGGNRFSLEAYLGNDRMMYDDSHYDINVTARWRNSLVSLGYNKLIDSLTHINCRAFFSSFASNVGVNLTSFDLKLPSSLWQTSLCGEMSRSFGQSGQNNLRTGAQISLYRFILRSGLLGATGNLTDPKPAEDLCNENRLFADTELSLNSKFRMGFGLSLDMWLNKPFFSGAVNPYASLIYSTGTTRLKAQLAAQSQYFHQVGLSEIGLATDFFMPASARVPVSRSYGMAITAFHTFLHDITLEESVYLRRISDEPEYNGQLLEMAYDSYDPESHIISGSGYNTGFAVTISKEFRRFTASASYSFGLARRRYPNISGWFRASTEQGHSFHVDSSWDITDHWNLQATFTYTSGRPYTPVTAIYVIAGNIVSEFGSHNSSRFPAYHRLDLSAAYHFSAEIGHTMVGNIINFSLLNAYGHRNIEMQTYDFDPENSTLRLHQRASLYRFLPSLSYTIQF